MSRSSRKIAVIHDFLYCYAGAERVLEQILNIYPEADLFSLFDFLKPEDRGFIKNKPVTATFIQRMPFAKRFHRAYLPLMPLAIEQLDLSGYDVVISSSYLAAKGVITRPDQLHICYCHTPVRFAWDMQRQYLTQSGLMRGLKSFAAKVLLHYIRGWDSRSSNGVDVFLTNSRFVSRRIQKVYRRQATPLYPPVDVENFQPSRAPRSGFLTASRLVPYKRIDLIIEAFNRMPDKQLTVIGDGPQSKQLKAMAGPNVNLMGYQPFDVLRKQMQSAEAFVFAAEEDFGIVPVEAQACGTPVIAYNRGGAAETVVEGETGVFFRQQTADSLIDAVREFDSMGEWSVTAIRRNAERFDASRFREQFAGVVESEWVQFNAERNRGTPSASPAMPELRPARWNHGRLPVDADEMQANVDRPAAAVAAQ